MILNGYALQEAMRDLTIKDSDPLFVRVRKADPVFVYYAKRFLAMRAELGLVYPPPPPLPNKK
jgi:hypothetical protein